MKLDINVSLDNKIFNDDILNDIKSMAMHGYLDPISHKNLICLEDTSIDVEYSSKIDVLKYLNGGRYTLYEVKSLGELSKNDICNINKMVLILNKLNFDKIYGVELDGNIYSMVLYKNYFRFSSDEGKLHTRIYTSSDEFDKISTYIKEKKYTYDYTNKKISYFTSKPIEIPIKKITLEDLLLDSDNNIVGILTK